MKLANITSVFRSKLIYNSYRHRLSSKDSVLDIGCGTGVVAQELNKRFNFTKIMGCDIEDYRILKLKFKKQSLQTSLPFNNNSFSKAMLNDVLHHTSYQNQKTLILESLRVANEVLIFELIPTGFSKYGDFLINKIHNSRMNNPFSYRKISEWENIFIDLHLKYTTNAVSAPFWYPFRHVAFRLVKEIK